MAIPLYKCESLLIHLCLFFSSKYLIEIGILTKLRVIVHHQSDVALSSSPVY